MRIHGENQIINILNFFWFFGLINLYVYENYGINFMKEDLKKRDLLFKLYEKWFFKLKLYRKPQSKKYLKSSHESFFKKRNIIQAASLFVRAIILYPFFWKLYKSSVFSYEFDSQNSLNMQGEETRKLIFFLKN